MTIQKESPRTTAYDLQRRATKKAPWSSGRDEKQGEWPKSLRYANPPSMNSDVYASDIQMDSHSCNNQGGKSGRIDEKETEAQLKEKKLP